MAKTYTNREISQELVKLRSDLKSMNKALRGEIGAMGRVFLDFQKTTEENLAKFHDFMIIELDRRTRNGRPSLGGKQMLAAVGTALAIALLALQILAKVVEK